MEQSDPENSPSSSGARGIYIAMLSVHGLIRGEEMELGRDADTGGQVKYVVELARALSSQAGVRRVDLFTRWISDPRVDASYARETEPLAPNAQIVRIPCGPRRYVRKELLWPYLDSFSDQILQYFRRIGQVPDVIHGHYADAGDAGANLAGVLGVPLVFTGHSLGRVKRERLLSSGLKPESIEKQYNVGRRIEAEEFTLDRASFVVASTRQEVEEQYALYDNYAPERMRVIRPGVDLSRFSPPRRGRARPRIRKELERFLVSPEKPMILALSRADPRKNVSTLIHAFGKSSELRKRANLVLILGDRETISDMEKTARDVMTSVLLLIDRYDLHGQVAYPKHHESDDVPDLYRLAARSRGVFVNPALTEPFGLTLLEAAASGVPVVATHDGGPRDILAECENGLLVDPTDASAIAEALLKAISDRAQWKQWSRAGIRGASRFGWVNHARQYLVQVRKALPRRRPQKVHRRSRLVTSERFIVADIDNTLAGDREGLEELARTLGEASTRVAFGVATGRHVKSALGELRRWGAPTPDLLITSVGSEIYYGPQIRQDEPWSRILDYRWKPDGLLEALKEVPGIELQSADGRRTHKISYDVDPPRFPGVREVRRELRRQGLHARLVYSHNAYLDVLPVRASKGHALRYLSAKWGIPLEKVLVAGDSGNDEEMLRGDTLGVVVGNHSPELERLRGRYRIHFASANHAWGILEGIRHYRFLEEVPSVPSPRHQEQGGGGGGGEEEEQEEHEEEELAEV